MYTSQILNKQRINNFTDVQYIEQNAVQWGTVRATLRKSTKGVEVNQLD